MNRHPVEMQPKGTPTTEWADKRLEQAYFLIQEVLDGAFDPESDAHNSLSVALECVENADVELERWKL